MQHARLYYADFFSLLENSGRCIIYAMKKILETIIVIILFVSSILIFWAGLAPKSFSNFFARYPEIKEKVDQTLDTSDITSSEPILGATGRLVINNNVWNVEIASNEADRVNGLSNRKTLRNKNGMLFAFDRQAAQTFWMKDMLIPIDMIFFDSNWNIVEIDGNLQPNSFPKVFGDKVKSKFVLEVNAGEADSYGLKVGDTAIFLNK